MSKPTTQLYCAHVDEVPSLGITAHEIADPVTGPEVVAMWDALKEQYMAKKATADILAAALITLTTTMIKTREEVKRAASRVSRLQNESAMNCLGIALTTMDEALKQTNSVYTEAVTGKNSGSNVQGSQKKQPSIELAEVNKQSTSQLELIRYAQRLTTALKNARRSLVSLGRDLDEIEAGARTFPTALLDPDLITEIDQALAIERSQKRSL